MTCTFANQRAALDRIARRLLEREVIEHDELIALIAGVQPADAAVGQREDTQPATAPQAQLPASSTMATTALSADVSKEAQPLQCSPSR